jgi:hypothetical protein
MKCCQSRPTNLYREPSRSACSSHKLLYLLISTATAFCLIFFLRDTTPVLFVKPSAVEDMKFESDTVGSKQLTDVYWRVSIRHITHILSEVCNRENYTVLTNKNIKSDNKRMKENYIYFCNPISDITAMLNARVVLSTITSKTIRCKETYGVKTKTVVRQYPFSLKYIDAVDFSPKTKIIRNGIEACTILHAIDIVNSVWD